MVGIVVVSHTHRLADGIAELARQMAGEDVRIETAGGTSDGDIGTDAVLIAEAVGRADTGDGVLVLMDLGSAILSAEMALEMIDPELRERALLSEGPVVEGAVSAAASARVGRPLAEVAAEARGAMAPKAAHLVPERAPEPPSRADDDGEELRIVLGNRLGLHARPAALLVRTAGSFEADVTVTNLATGAGPASARSLNDVATLGARQGHEIAVRASGPDARRVLEAVRALAADNFGDRDDAPPAPQVRPPPPAPDATGRLRGLAASGGAAVGPARHLHRTKPEVVRDTIDDPAREWARLEHALEGARREIEASRRVVLEGGDAEAAAIFDAHLLFLEDEALIGPVRRAIVDESRGAEWAWDDAIEAAARRFEALDDDYQRARAADVREVGLRVLTVLAGGAGEARLVAAPGILVADELTAAEVAGLAAEDVAGIASATGGPTAHAAIVARSLGIPAVVGLGPGLLSITEGTIVALDGDQGALVVDPPPELAAEFEAVAAERAAARSRAARRAAEPARTRDGSVVEVSANAGTVADARRAAAAGADGIGLLRTEFLLAAFRAPPDEKEQADLYAEVADALEGKTVIVRTLDAGADKPLPFLTLAREENPFLGVRGVRLATVMPSVLDVQLRALLRAAAGRRLRVMFPMVSGRDELLAARQMLERGRAALAAEGIRAGEPEVGIMIEIPSAALLAGRLAPDVDFFSIGTNDLSQYVMAADRTNERVAALADPLHPAVLRLIGEVAAAAGEHGRWTGVCGELAGDAAATPLLLGLGITELSVAPALVPEIKEAVRGVRLADAQDLAGRALDCATAADVRTLLETGTGA